MPTAARGDTDTPGSSPPPEPNIPALRARARRLKDDAGLTIDDLTGRSGLSRTAILDMLNGRGHVELGNVKTWWALAHALGVPFGELMAGLEAAGSGDDGTT